MKKTVVLAAAIAAGFGAFAVEPTGFAKKIEIAVDYRPGSVLADFPVLVRLSAAIDGFSYDDFKLENGGDLRFTDADDNYIPHEIDTWDKTGTSFVWVKIPSLEYGAVIKAFYGNATPPAALASTAVWTGYAGVWHMNSANPADSTGNEHDGTGTDVTLADGKVGKGLVYNGSSSLVSCGTITDNSFSSSGVSVSAWGVYANKERAFFGIDTVMSFRLESTTKMVMTTPKLKDHEISGSFASGAMAQYALAFSPNSSCVGYCNGAQCGSVNNPSDIANPSAVTLWLGGNQWPAQCWSGVLDEVRFTIGVRSANWIAAEYATVDNAAFLSYGNAASMDDTAPVFAEPPTLVANADGTFAFSATMIRGSATSICAVYTDVLTGGAITNTLASGSLESPYSVEENASLPPGSMYTFAVYGVNAGGTEVYRLGGYPVLADAVTIEKTSDASEALMSKGVFTVSRPSTAAATAGELTVPYSVSGTAVAGETYRELSGSVTFAPGEATAAIDVEPIYSSEVDGDVTVIVTLGRSVAFVGDPGAATMNVVNTVGDIYTRYVATTGSDDNDGLSTETPMLTIARAVEILAPIASSEHPGKVYVAPGVYSLPKTVAPVTITNAIEVAGTGDSPEAVIVQRTQRPSWNDSHIQAIVHMNHADAKVSNLVMNYGSILQPESVTSAGTAWIGPNGGTISNCVLRSGYSSHPYCRSSGILMRGNGLITHCVITNMTADSGVEASWGPIYGLAVELTAGRMENCFIGFNSAAAATSETDNDRTCTILAKGDAQIVNCTVVGNKARRVAGIYADAAGVTVKNCVIAGNEDIGADKSSPTCGGAGSFVNCATDDGEPINESCIAGTAAVFFKDWESGDYTPGPDSPLRNAGADAGFTANDVDLAGMSRVVGSRIDIGCYEAPRKGFVIRLK